MDMRDYLISFMDRTFFPKEGKGDILEAYDVLMSEVGEAALLPIIGLYRDETFSYKDVVSKWQEACSKSSLCQFQSDIILVISLCKRLEALYERKGLEDELFIETMKDIAYKAVECKLVKGMYGTFVTRWFEDFFTLNRFCFGRLQFEIRPFGIDYKDIKADALSINIHIPRTGTPLNKEAVDLSFSLADSFYKNILGDRLIYKCNSWLLFPRNREFLKEGSNILSFMDRFEIIKVTYDEDYSQLWRLFDCEYKNPDSLPGDTSLRRSYISLARGNEPVGEGFGFFIKDL